MIPQGVGAISSMEDGVLKVAEQAAKASLQEAAKQTGGGASESGFLGWFLVGIVTVGLGSALLRQKRFSEGFEEKKHASDTPPKPDHA
jgi:2-keto-3-deoxy-6-phosphogluconate aldolase